MQPPLDLDRLIERIRAEAARPEFQVATVPTPTILTDGPQTEFGTPVPARTKHAPPVRDFDGLLRLTPDERFVEEAYRLLLQRDPDAEGLVAMSQLLRDGRSRCWVLNVLKASTEARQVGAQVPGFGVGAPLYTIMRALARVRLGVLAGVLDKAYDGWRRFRMQSPLVSRLTQRNVLERLETRLDELERRNEEQGAQLAGAVAALRGQHERLDDIGQRLDEAGRSVALQRVRTNMLYRRLLPGAVPSAGAHDVPPRTDPSALSARIDAYYLAFEDAHRGSEDSVRERLRPYLDYLAALPEDIVTRPLVDLGCGRGEWLRMLADQGFTAIGVDLNADMVAHCRAHGLDAHATDALSWLAAQADDSVAAISAFHLVEHLPFDILFPIMEQAARVLAPGGLLILETPNPENVLVGSHTFYHDFSHRNPVTPTSLEFLVGYHGLSVIDMPRLNPYPPSHRVAGDSPVADRINGHFCGPQDYAVIARKPAPEPSAAHGEHA